jgi:hypothetical protein
MKAIKSYATTVEANVAPEDQVEAAPTALGDA